MFVSPSFLRLLPQQGQSRSSQIPSFSSSYSCFAAHCFQSTVLACCNSIFFISFGHTHVNSSCAFKNQGVPMRPLDAQICGFAHHRSCWTSHLPPRLNFNSLIDPSFFLFDWPFSNPYTFCPMLCGQSREIFLHLKTKSIHEQG